MVRALGIDPGTFSFDLCGLEDGEVVFEKVIPTAEVAKKPRLLVDGCREALPLNLIVGPSGYGVSLTYLSDVDDPEAFAITALLLSRPKDIEEAYKRKELGAMVYKAIAVAVGQLKELMVPVCFVPGVIHLPTVPAERKVNRIDMGTADKMCVAVLGVYDQARRLNLSYSEVSFILVEMGFGYNAVIGVDRGRIVDGIGGTTGSIGFLAMGAVDAEVAQLIGKWERSDVFYGGVRDVTGKEMPEDFITSVGSNELCELAWRAMMESMEKSVAAMRVSVPKPREILFSGRLTKIPKIREELIFRLSKYGEVKPLGSLEGAKLTKETGQGYAIVADGIANGKFKDLIEWMQIKEASGTALDYIFHPKGKALRKLLDRWYPKLTEQT
ncbi:MAG: DUF1464 domain-containing protein [Thermoprotei archaeon]|nr:MAG: DUF1464 domain-containing protein [Thermoprotei archaeon]